MRITPLIPPCRPGAFVACLALTAALLLGGCQTWMRGGAEHVSTRGYRLQVRPDWIFHPNMLGDFIATKDGVVLQQLLVQRTALTQPLPNTKRKLDPGLSGFELAEALIDDLRQDRTLLQLDVKENAPAALGGVPGCRLVIDYRMEDGLHLTSARYACLHEGQLYVVSYTAPSRHYFARDLPAFEEMVRSFAFTAE